MRCPKHGSFCSIPGICSKSFCSEAFGSGEKEHFIPFADMSEISNSSRYVLKPNSIVWQWAVTRGCMETGVLVVSQQCAALQL